MEVTSQKQPWHDRSRLFSLRVTTTCLKQLCRNPVGATGLARVQFVGSLQSISESELPNLTRTFQDIWRFRSTPRLLVEPTTTQCSVPPTDLRCLWRLRANTQICHSAPCVVRELCQQLAARSCTGSFCHLAQRQHWPHATLTGNCRVGRFLWTCLCS